MRTVKVSSTPEKFKQDITIGHLHLNADEPVVAGGRDEGPSPHELLLASLGACKAMTVKMYAERKGWNLAHVAVELSQVKEGDTLKIQVHLTVEGDLDEQQRQRLLEIADRCPIHRTLTSNIEIQSHY